MKPDFDRAAVAALEILKERKISETPILSLPILKNYPGVRVMSFTNMAYNSETDRGDIIPLFGDNQDAATLKVTGMDDVDYIVIYNMQLPHEDIRRAVARELGHIVLGHDGETRPANIRRAEALCFAHHLLTPRPIVQMIKKSNIPFTMNVLVHTTGCSEDCVNEIREIPGVHVPAELNREIRDLFSPHIMEYIRFHQSAPKKDTSGIIDFGSYMDFYEE